MKNAIFIMTDPTGASAEATSKLLNALGFADECQRCGDELAIVFAGAGTRWPQELTKVGHPANLRYNSLRAHVKGASRSCALRNSAVEGVTAAGLPLIDDNAVAGTQGVASFRRYYAENWHVSIF